MLTSLRIPVRLPLVGLAVAGVGLAAWTSLQEPTYEIRPVAGTVSILAIPGGGNMGLCQGDDGLVVVDSHLAQSREAVLAAIAERTGDAPRFLLNTHWHADHTGTNEAFGAQRVPIVAHANVRARLVGAEGVEGRTGEDVAPAALPTVTYRDALDLHLNGERIEVRHYGAGHTDGDSVVFFHGSKVVHVGDLCFNGLFPFIDAGSGGDPVGYAAAMRHVLDSIDETWKVIPGHGPEGGREDLARCHAMLVTAIERVQGALAEGVTVEEMVEGGLLEEYEDWSWSFISTQRFLGDLATALR